jgi:hypothetical protein
MARDPKLGIFVRRLAETIAWCSAHVSSDAPRDCLRSPLLEPSRLYVWEVGRPGTAIVMIAEGDERLAIVEEVAARRAAVLIETGWIWDGKRPAIGGGRLLAFHHDQTLSDGAAERSSLGFFDTDNQPPWDTWVDYHPGAESSGSFLVSWVPPALVEVADRGVRSNPELCIQWLDALDTPWTRSLRDHGIA